MSEIRMCRCGCGKPATFVCSDCKSAAYYSEDCQKRDWPVHRQICFAETGLDTTTEVKTERVGVEFKLRANAVRLTEEQLPEKAKKILLSLRYVANGIYCIPADRFNREITNPEEWSPFPGVRAETGAIYLRGCAGTREFEESMRKLSRIDSDEFAKSYLLHQNYEFMTKSMESIEPEFRTFGEPRESIEAKMELLATMADMVLLVEGTPGYADLLNTANWVIKMQKFIDEQARISGISSPGYSQQIERVLNGVWSRVDIGLYLEHTEDLKRVAKIPFSLVMRCKKLTLPIFRVEVLRELLSNSPVLTSVKFTDRVLEGENIMLNQGQTEMLFRALPKSIEKLSISGYTQLYEDFDWVTSERFPLLRKLRMWMPRSTAGIPSTVEDLTLSPMQRGNVIIRDIVVARALPSVKKLRLNFQAHAKMLGHEDAEVLAAAFPKIEALDLSPFRGFNIIGLMPTLLSKVPSLVDLKFSMRQGMFSELLAYLGTLKEQRLRSLKLIDSSPEPSVATSDLERATLVALASSRAIRKLGLCMGTEGVWATPIATRFDVLDVNLTLGIPRPRRLPPARILSITRASIDDAMSDMIDPTSRPKALIFGWAPYVPFTHLIPEGMLSELISLSMWQHIPHSDIIEWLEKIMGAAPKLEYLHLMVSSSGLPTRTRATPMAHIPIDTLYVEIDGGVNLLMCLRNIMDVIGSPRNFIVSIEDKVDPTNFIRWLKINSPNTRTLCISRRIFDLPPNKELYPLNVFTMKTFMLSSAKLNELTWFIDPWNHKLDKL